MSTQRYSSDLTLISSFLSFLQTRDLEPEDAAVLLGIYRHRGQYVDIETLAKRRLPLDFRKSLSPADVDTICQKLQTHRPPLVDLKKKETNCYLLTGDGAIIARDIREEGFEILLENWTATYAEFSNQKARVGCETYGFANLIDKELILKFISKAYPPLKVKLLELKPADTMWDKKQEIYEQEATIEVICPVCSTSNVHTYTFNPQTSSERIVIRCNCGFCSKIYPILNWNFDKVLPCNITTT